jgi:hypothetical protein
MSRFALQKYSNLAQMLLANLLIARVIASTVKINVMGKYTNKKLEELANGDLIWVKPSDHYRKLLKESIEQKGWDYSKLEDDNECNDICHDNLWYDVCAIVNDLAQLVLDEREKRAKFLDELKRELKGTLNNLSSKKFDEFY